MSKFLNISLALVAIATLLAGCATPTPAPTAAAPAATSAPQVVTQVVEQVVQATPVPITHHYKFAWIMPDMFNPFWVYMRQGAEKAAVELKAKGIQVDIQQMAPIDTFNVAEQVSLFENAIQMKVDGIGICVIDQTAVIDQTNKAVAAGIPVAALSTDIPNSNRTIYAGVDNVAEAQHFAQMLIDANGGKGGYIILSGLTGNFISEQRDQGFKAAIAANPGTKLLDKQPAEFNRAKGQNVMESLIQKYPSFDAVFGANDEMIIGAVEAMAAANVKGKVTIGFDATPDAFQYMKEGKLGATIDQFPGKQASKALTYLVDYIKTKKMPPMKVEYLQPEADTSAP